MTPSNTAIWTLIIGMGIVNFAERFVPLSLVSRFELPTPVRRWLSFVPISVMGSLFATQVLMPAGRYVNPLTSPWLYAALATMLVYRFTRSFLGATVAGMVAFVALRTVLGG